ncbi:Uma2 family endonuclease [Kitasatospora sp. MAP12-15]|uniref:Uma2 family endonuclease n=1 Tax=unclassified Kitasatospora TaxID=2633591 RepID=UPI0024736575|nr:Uma2 family endonuclease [Kitasatospora sp. MAP12-44]MDH6115192.1 Uma2 family endonuclease [Kitasatospora sp. MAP12-44]
MTTAHEDYSNVADPERALKYAVQRLAGDRAEIIEGVITPMSPSWAHENAADVIREQLGPRMRALGLRAGSGNLDLPQSENWYIPDLAVVPAELAKTEGALLPHQTLLVVEITSPTNADTDRIVKRRRYAQYGAPLYLLVDRQARTCTLFSQPGGHLGYTRVEGPHPFGTSVRLPEPFDLDLDTTDL